MFRIYLKLLLQNNYFKYNNFYCINIYINVTKKSEIWKSR